jgi:hypothetical protein
MVALTGPSAPTPLSVGRRSGAAPLWLLRGRGWAPAVGLKRCGEVDPGVGLGVGGG